MKKLIFFSLLVTLGLTSCLPGGYKYPEGTLPSVAVNLEAFNTSYDDYNSTAPSLGTLIPFCFSTNRISNGDNFDIIYRPMNINWDKNTGELSVISEYGNWEIYREPLAILEDALDLINSQGNELGPYLAVNETSGDIDFLFLYASDATGNYRISFTYSGSSSSFNECQEIEFLNSASDDLYPAFNKDYSKIYFCSNRNSDVFNIYSTDLQGDAGQLVTELGNPGSREIIMEESLSGSYNDKCPYIYSDIMVFASDRPGGEGGYDLYYSLFTDGQWGDPVSFGPSVNSPYDEYRPVIVNESVDHNRDMIIFSSDRPGGQGGFDLYFAGIDQHLHIY